MFALASGARRLPGAWSVVLGTARSGTEQWDPSMGPPAHGLLVRLVNAAQGSGGATLWCRGSFHLVRAQRSPGSSVGFTSSALFFPSRAAVRVFAVLRARCPFVALPSYAVMGVCTRV